MKKVYVLQSDPEHGWLAVPMSEIDQLGVRDKVSSFSYRLLGGRKAFLEEDCDAGIFLDAARAAGWEVGIRHDDNDDNCRIRNLPGFWE